MSPISTQPMTGTRIACAVATTFLACQLLFGCVHFGLKWCRCRRTKSWHDGLPWSLGITHSIVFIMACLQNVIRAILFPSFWGKKDNDYPWDFRLLLLYYESCVLSFFIILSVAAIYLSIHPPRRAQERCDDTVEVSSVESA